MPNLNRCKKGCPALMAAFKRLVEMPLGLVG